MKIVYSKFISGASASRFKVKGDKKSVKNWRNNVIEQTKDGIGIINKECRMKVIFKFHSSRYPTDFPYGPDLDNHIKNLWDGLNETIFKNAPGHDSCVKILHASKHKVEKEKEAGVKIEISYI